MRADFPASFITQMQAHDHELFLTACVHFTNGAGDLYISDREATIGGKVHLKAVPKDGWGELSSLIQRDASNLDVGAMGIDFFNIAKAGFGRLSDYLRLESTAVEVDVWWNFVDARPGSDSVDGVAASITRAKAFTAVIQGQPTTWDEVSGTMSLLALHQKYLDRPMINVIDPITYPRADASALNRPIPIPMGLVERVPGAIIENVHTDSRHSVVLRYPNRGTTLATVEDPNSGYSKVLLSEYAEFFGNPVIGDVQWAGEPIRPGNLWTSLSASNYLNAYVDLLLKERADDGEIILASRFGGAFLRYATIGQNNADYDQIIVPITIPGDITNPVLQNMTLALGRQNNGDDPGAIAVRVTKILEAYGVPNNDFYGDNSDQSLGFYGWPSGDVLRRNLDSRFIDHGGGNDDVPLDSADAPLEPGRTYHIKYDARNSASNPGDGVSNYQMPLYSPDSPNFDPLQIMTAEAFGRRAGSGAWESLGGGPYIAMSVRGGGGASVHTKDTSPLGPQSGAYVAIVNLPDKGIVARRVTAALSAGGEGSSATLELVSLNAGPKLGQTAFSVTFDRDSFTDESEIVARPTPLSQYGPSGIISRTYYRVKKDIPLTLIPAGQYAVRFSGNTQQTLTHAEAPQEPPAMLGGIVDHIFTGAGASFAPVSRVPTGGGGIFSAPRPPAASSPAVEPNMVTTPLGDFVQGTFDIIGIQFGSGGDYDGYSKVNIENYGVGSGLADPNSFGARRKTRFLNFDCALPAGQAISADLAAPVESPVKNIEHALKNAYVPAARINLPSEASLGSVIRFNGLLDQPMTYKQAILKMCFEGHLSFAWDVDTATVRNLDRSRKERRLTFAATDSGYRTEPNDGGLNGSSIEWNGQSSLLVGNITNVGESRAFFRIDVTRMEYDAGKEYWLKIFVEERFFKGVTLGDLTLQEIDPYTTLGDAQYAASVITDFGVLTDVSSAVQPTNGTYYHQGFVWVDVKAAVSAAKTRAATFMCFRLINTGEEEEHGELEGQWYQILATSLQIETVTAPLPPPAPAFTITRDMITQTRKVKNVRVTRSDTSKVANYIRLKYARDWSGGGNKIAVAVRAAGGEVPIFVQTIAPYQRALELIDFPSVMLYGRLERESLFRLDLIADDLSANEFGGYAIRYFGRPKDTVEVTLMTPAMGVENDDLTAFAGV